MEKMYTDVRVLRVERMYLSASELRVEKQNQTKQITMASVSERKYL